MTTRRLGLLGAGLLAVLAACCSNGTETDNPGGPEVAFQGSQCAHEGTSHDSGPPPSNGTQSRGAVGTSMARLEVAGDYTRLECIAWHRDGSTLHVSIRNFHAGCGIEWDGAAATVDGGDVQLEPHNPRCIVARCGSCFYDMEFDVKGVPEDGELRVSARVTDLDGKACQDRKDPLLTVPESEASGVRCGVLAPQAFLPPPEDCERYASCSESCTCMEGTTCVSEDGAAVCVPACTTPGDCPVPGAFECTQGLCKALPRE